MSRHAKPFDHLAQSEKREVDEINNTLYMLHTAPIIDCLSLRRIAEALKNDDILMQVMSLVRKGKAIPPAEAGEVKKFDKILNEITITGNRILLKGD